MVQVSSIIAMNKVDFLAKPLFPMFHSMPLGLIKNSSLYPMHTNSCVKWIAYDYNSGQFDKSLLDKILNDPLRDYCDKVGKKVPFYKNMPAEKMNTYIRDEIAKKSELPLVPGKDIEGNEIK